MTATEVFDTMINSIALRSVLVEADLGGGEFAGDVGERCAGSGGAMDVIGGRPPRETPVDRDAEPVAAFARPGPARLVERGCLVDDGALTERQRCDGVEAEAPQPSVLADEARHELVRRRPHEVVGCRQLLDHARRRSSARSRSASRKASSTSWVTSTMVLRTLVCRSSSSSCSRARTIGSTAPNGSSMSSTGGSAASALATPTRCCCPPDSSSGYRSSKVVIEADERGEFLDSCSDARLVPTEHRGNRCDVARHAFDAGTARPVGSRSRCRAAGPAATGS